MRSNIAKKVINTPSVTITPTVKKQSSQPKKNDETSEKLPTWSDCILSTTIFA